MVIPIAVYAPTEPTGPPPTHLANEEDDDELVRILKAHTNLLTTRGHLSEIQAANHVSLWNYDTVDELRRLALGERNQANAHANNQVHFGIQTLEWPDNNPLEMTWLLLHLNEKNTLEAQRFRYDRDVEQLVDDLERLEQTKAEIGALSRRKASHYLDPSKEMTISQELLPANFINEFKKTLVFLIHCQLPNYFNKMGMKVITKACTEGQFLTTINGHIHNYANSNENAKDDATDIIIEDIPATPTMSTPLDTKPKKRITKKSDPEVTHILTEYTPLEDKQEQVHKIVVYDIPYTWSPATILAELKFWGNTIKKFQAIVHDILEEMMMSTLWMDHASTDFIRNSCMRSFKIIQSGKGKELKWCRYSPPNLQKSRKTKKKSSKASPEASKMNNESKKSQPQNQGLNNQSNNKRKGVPHLL
ncbi:hypothetical protein C1646_769601 [Rhizophagus diaphanus]|nr:hypothetical protein C1646_769601 [Rhizophagus diaphanus] [Rhizophagus sp. MUCL 43196]